MYIPSQTNILGNEEIDHLVKNALGTFPIPALIKKDVRNYYKKIL